MKNQFYVSSMCFELFSISPANPKATIVLDEPINKNKTEDDNKNKNSIEVECKN